MEKSELYVDPGLPLNQPARTVLLLLRYKAWANRLAFDAIRAIPEEEAFRPRPTTFKNMVHTLNHIYVVDDIFKHHLTGRKHGYLARNTDETPPIATLSSAMEEMDHWYLRHVEAWTEDDLRTSIEFEFVGGGAGTMTKEEIILHVVNHATYHRGFVGDMLRQVPYYWQANDLTVFIRDQVRPRI